MARRKTQEEWLKEIITKFPENKEKYDYSKVNYVNNRTHITIHCNKCNKDFLQKPLIFSV